MPAHSAPPPSGPSCAAAPGPSAGPSGSVRPFRRADREHLTELINRHAAAVLPGVSASVNTVLGSLERRPDEYVTDPWVAERVTLVAEADSRVVAAAHLLRYRSGAEVGESYRGLGELDWFVHYPEAGAGCADHLMTACLAQLTAWGCSSWHADGKLPVPGVYGVPEPWPHIRAQYERAGFRHTGHTEVLLLADVCALPAAPAPHGLTVRRTLDDLGTRLEARLAGRCVGHLTIDTGLERAERRPRDGGLADIADLDLAADAPEHTLTTLLARAADWLRWCGVDRLLAYAYDTETDETHRLRRHGFTELTRTERGWTRDRA